MSETPGRWSKFSSFLLQCIGLRSNRSREDEAVSEPPPSHDLEEGQILTGGGGRPQDNDEVPKSAGLPPQESERAPRGTVFMGQRTFVDSRPTPREESDSETKRPAYFGTLVGPSPDRATNRSSD